MVNKQKLRILEISNFSSGGCGVFARVLRESKLLVKNGHEVAIFSSDIIKGTNEIAKKEEIIGGIKIKRFPAKKLGGESFMFWNFYKEGLNFKPDIIIAHGYRHLHTHQALKLAKKLNAKVFLVTHAPFKRNDTRSFKEKIAVSLYDYLIGPKNLKRFNKVISISNWESPYLNALGLNKESITYIPNGIDSSFFKVYKNKRINRVLYMGRIAPIKDLETPIISFSRETGCQGITIFGPPEKDYLKKLKNIILKNNLKSKVRIISKKYDLALQIKEMNKFSIFVLPSKSEGMPQALVEAMASRMIVLASDIPANRDIIKNWKNGFLFKRGDNLDLASKLILISKLSKGESNNIREQAKRSVEKFNWKNIIKRVERLFNGN
jgi:glycosyltransferase involved in cell wall biosynthesis